MGRTRSAAGILGSVQRLAAAGRAFAHSPHPALDRGRYLGLHPARKHPDHPALSRQGRQTLSLARRCRHHQSRDFKRVEYRGNPDRARRHQSAGARRPRARPRNRRRLRAAARRRLSLTDIELSDPMNMIVPSAVSATPNGTTRPLVRIVIVGHVDHGKSTLVGRLLHETGSLPEGKLEMLQAVSARRGMPFEWSFLLDALQTERDQGITIDTTQISFRTGSRDIVLIDAPGHAEFLRNMITGASQADGAVLIIDALEGVRDQTRRHGYLLHLLGIKQVAIVVNKMDRVDFSADRFKEISDEISAHLIGLGVTPSAVIPLSPRHGDGVAERTPRIGWYQRPIVVEALDSLEPARPLQALALRLPLQAI